MNASTSSNVANYLPDDLDRALLIGRVWRRTGAHEGPSVVVVRNGDVFDITSSAPTTADLFERDDAPDLARDAPGERLCSAAELIAASLADDASAKPRLLAPCDVQP
ncbi:MAG TPA: fumarylacetoacetate hydrolase, partial [Paraburkholderia sp.]|nr:fumarylacetoacetate hydrolase [Paraburkholderia sp.]